MLRQLEHICCISNSQLTRDGVRNVFKLRISISPFGTLAFEQLLYMKEIIIESSSSGISYQLGGLCSNAGAARMLLHRNRNEIFTILS